LFERYQRSERALVATLAEMYAQGVSTIRKVKAITEELCGHSFSASSISTINKRLDEGPALFARRLLAELEDRSETARLAGDKERFAFGREPVCIVHLREQACAHPQFGLYRPLTSNRSPVPGENQP
jgi:hypothetical protein